MTAAVLDFAAPVGRENLAGRVYETLRVALFEGRLSPGQRLRIRDLAAAMQVSETPVREAVVQLAPEAAGLGADIRVVRVREQKLHRAALARLVDDLAGLLGEGREIDRVALEGHDGGVALGEVLTVDDFARIARAADVIDAVEPE